MLDPEHFANNMHSDCGLYFMDLDMGIPSKKEDYQKIYHEKETRLFAGNSPHDLTHGVYVTDADRQLFEVEDGTLLYGNLQAEAYFIAHKAEIKEWLKVKPEYDCREYGQQIRRIQRKNQEADLSGEKKVYANAGERLGKVSEGRPYRAGLYIMPVIMVWKNGMAAMPERYDRFWIGRLRRRTS